MRLWLVAVHIVLVGCSVWAGRVYEEANVLEDNEFAEFEQFDADDELVVSSSDMLQEQGEATAPKASATQQNQFVSVDEADEMIVEDEDNEFEHFQDPEEFEGFHDNAQRTEAPKITIKQMPILVRSRWDAYWMEFLLCCGIVAYGLSWAIGKGRNTSIALTFSKLHRPFLEENFTFIGEPISMESGDSGLSGWRREADHLFTMWCSGRTCCEGMLLTLKLIKRQDLVHLLAGIVKPSFDTLQIKVDMAKEDSDNFVMCVAQKKTAVKLAKEMADLSTFCPERRPGDKLGLPANMSVMSELVEATAGVLDTRVTAAINKYAHLIDYIHVSDQYSGLKQQEESTPATKPPDTQRSIVVGLILPCKGEGTEEGCEAIRPLLVLVFYLMEKLKRFKLSKEASAKSEKHRREVAEAWQKGAHAVRAEQAAQRREERRKQEKERIMAEDDPEKQRRWEKKEQKRQLKRKTPKMKQLKVKAL